MEDLNNHQLILLSTLVAFVTSIATGIITVSLLQEAPQTVTQTVNRVVERTIERVVTGTTTQEKSQPTTITNEVTKEVTVYAKEDDLIVNVVEKNQPRLIQIYRGDAATSSQALGTGFFVARDGLIMTTLSNLQVDGATLNTYKVSVGDKTYSAKPVDVKNIPKNLAFLRIADAAKDESFDAVTFGVKTQPRLGQTVVALGGDEATGIFKTTLTRFVYEKTDATSSAQVLSGIEVSPKIPEGYSGALIVNLDGLVVGMSVWNEEASRYVILPAARLLDAVDALSTKSSVTSKEPGSTLQS